MVSELHRRVVERSYGLVECYLHFIRNVASSDDGHRRIANTPQSITILLDVSALAASRHQPDIASGVMEVIHQLCGAPCSASLLSHASLVPYIVKTALEGTEYTQLLALNSLLSLLDSRSGCCQFHSTVLMQAYIGAASHEPRQR